MKQLILATACALTSAAIAAAQTPPPAPCTPAGGLSFVCGIQNGEDLVLVPNTRWLIASGMAAGSGLHAVDTQAKVARTLYGGGTAAARPDRTTYANCPGPLDPKLMVLVGVGSTLSEPGVICPIGDVDAVSDARAHGPLYLLPTLVVQPERGIEIRIG